MIILWLLAKACTGTADFIDSFREPEEQNDDDQKQTDDQEEDSPC